LPGGSLLKSKGGSGGVVAKALIAADKTFSRRSKLPDRKHASTGGPLDGRKRLGGAFLIDSDRIRPDPDQPRKRLDTDSHKNLVVSVRKLGILQPITVRFLESQSVYQIISGERRYLAAKQANLKEIPCWIQAPKEKDILLHQIVENWQRLDMHPYDLADALARLRDSNGYSQKQIAKATGKSEGEISKLLSLLTLDPAVEKLAREDDTGFVTKRHLYAVRTLPPEKQQALIRKVQDEGITADETERRVAKHAGRPRGVKKRRTPASCHRIKTSRASITITFRKRDVTTKDVLGALDEARKQVTRPDDPRRDSSA
jgi:ParB/RepB/Spo0J family partition protein